MDFAEWEKTIAPELTGDRVWKFEAYRLAVYVADLSWGDVTALIGDRRTVRLADQLYRAVGSVGANISEGFSRRSVKDQARFYEYALGSAREARGWYHHGRHVLGGEVAAERIRLLTSIIRLLLAMIPAQRPFKMREDGVDYDS